MKQVVCLHHSGCPDCIAGSTATMRSEQPPSQLPFTGQSHTASSASSHAATGAATAGVSSSSSTRSGTASEQAQLTGRSQAGRVTKACSSIFTELHAYGCNVMLDVTSCRTAHSTHPGWLGVPVITNTARHWANAITLLLFVLLSVS